MKIYLASPLGFSEVGREYYYSRVVPLLVGQGHEVLDPWKLTDQGSLNAVIQMPFGAEKQAAWAQLNMVIGENNRKAIDACDAVVAILDGTDVDSGTASEVGYAFARGKLIFGYRGDFRLSSDNEGGIVNLQVEYFIRASGGDIARSLDALKEMTTGSK